MRDRKKKERLRAKPARQSGSASPTRWPGLRCVSEFALRENRCHLRPVPIISIFFGIVIRMYHDAHPAPHIHASYQGFEALIRHSDGEIVAGSLPKMAALIVRQWVRDHQPELQENWQRGVNLLPMEMIPEADLDD